MEVCDYFEVGEVGENTQKKPYTSSCIFQLHLCCNFCVDISQHSTFPFLVLLHPLIVCTMPSRAYMSKSALCQRSVFPNSSEKGHISRNFLESYVVRVASMKPLTKKSLINQRLRSAPENILPKICLRFFGEAGKGHSLSSQSYSRGACEAP